MVHFKSIAELTKFVGYHPPEHAYLSLVKVKEARALLTSFPSKVTFGFYTIGLKKNLKGYLKYGRKHYDFQEGVLVFTAPGQLISYENLIIDESEGWYLFFDKSLLQKTSLQERFDRYRFFNYGVDEALHLSGNEEDHMSKIFKSLYSEYKKPIDPLSKSLLVCHLEMLLIYSERYYRRQFTTRNIGDSSLLTNFEKVLDDLCSLSSLETKGIPSVKDVSDKMNFSSNYLSDSIKSITGMGVQKHIHFRLIDLAKERLLSNSSSISEVAYGLGFESHTYFSRLFKQIEGKSPKEFLSIN